MGTKLILSAEERKEIVTLASEGYTRKMIARKLHLPTGRFNSHPEWQEAFLEGNLYPTEQAMNAMGRMATSGENLSATKWWLQMFSGMDEDKLPEGVLDGITGTQNEQATFIVEKVFSSQLSLTQGEKAIRLLYMAQGLDSAADLDKRLTELEGKNGQ